MTGSTAKAAEFLDDRSASSFLDDDEADHQPVKRRRLLEDLLDAVSETLGRAAEAVEGGRESSADVAAQLAKLVKAIESRKSNSPVSALTSAIKSLRDVTVNVSPTPLTITPVVQVIERAKAGAFEMRFTYDRDDRLQTAVLVPLESIPKLKEPAKMFGGGE